ncbi:MAG: hypothetical protein LBO72_06425 [Helicobacteraceae bacterium]|jgi:hypothetical protein|nr:hypothetical protein [Helicobacteraceae bacterium]
MIFVVFRAKNLAFHRANAKNAKTAAPIPRFRRGDYDRVKPLAIERLNQAAITSFLVGDLSRKRRQRTQAQAPKPREKKNELNAKSVERP